MDDHRKIKSGLLWYRCNGFNVMFCYSPALARPKTFSNVLHSRPLLHQSLRECKGFGQR